MQNLTFKVWWGFRFCPSWAIC